MFPPFPVVPIRLLQIINSRFSISEPITSILNDPSSFSYSSSSGNNALHCNCTHHLISSVDHKTQLSFFCETIIQPSKIPLPTRLRHCPWSPRIPSHPLPRQQSTNLRCQCRCHCTHQPFSQTRNGLCLLVPSQAESPPPIPLPQNARRRIGRPSEPLGREGRREWGI